MRTNFTYGEADYLPGCSGSILHIYASYKHLGGDKPPLPHHTVAQRVVEFISRNKKGIHFPGLNFGRVASRRRVIRLGAILAGLSIIWLGLPAWAGKLDLSWSAPTLNADNSPLTDLAGYRIYLGTSGVPCPGTYLQQVTSATPAPSAGNVVSTRVSGINAGVSYIVQVTAVDGSGNESSCSNAATGVAAKDPNPPGSGGPATPIGSIPSTAPTYTWNADPTATWYELWVADANRKPVIQQWYTAAQAGCLSAAKPCSGKPNKPLPAGSYTWWVQTWNETGYGPWSEGSFFTVSLSSPSAAYPTSPMGSVTTTAPTYTWNAVPSATWYYLWVDDGNRTPMLQQWYTAAQANCLSGSGACTVAPGTALPAGSYTWWVQTWNSSGYGPWSSSLGFTTGP